MPGGGEGHRIQIELPDLGIEGTLDDALRSLSGPRATLKNLRSWRMSGKTNYTALSATARTASSTFLLPGGFDLIRLAYSNDDLSATTTIDKATIASAAKLANSGYDPLDASGAAMPWTNVTFNNAGADGLAPSPSGAAASVTVPVALSVEDVGWAYSDWTPLSSVDRVDGGPHKLLVVRSLISTAGRAPLDTANLAAWQAGAGRSYAEYRAGLRTTDLTASGSFGASAPSQGYLVPHAVQWYSRGLGATVMVVGDSTFQGSSSTSLNAGFGFLACEALSTPSRPVVLWNGGWRGQLSAPYFARARKEFDAVRPEVVVIKPYSSNDSNTTQAIADAAFMRAIDFAYYAMSKGAVVIMATPQPCNLGESIDPIRRGIVQRVKNLGSFLTVDFEAALGTGATPNKFRPEYDSGDGVHPNDAGHAAQAAVLIPVLARALGRPLS